ncbi:unnamed protein product [Lota lota]
MAHTGGTSFHNLDTGTLDTALVAGVGGQRPVLRYAECPQGSSVNMLSCCDSWLNLKRYNWLADLRGSGMARVLPLSRSQPPSTASVLYPPQSEMSLQSPRDWSGHGASAEDVKHPRDSDATSNTAAGDDKVSKFRLLRSAIKTHQTKTKKKRLPIIGGLQA